MNYKIKRKNIDELKNIYDGSNRVSARFERKKFGLTGIIFFSFISLILIGLAMLSGYYIFREPVIDEFQSDNIIFDIKGNDSIISGEEVFYVIDLRNKSNVLLSNGEIRVIYPNGFRLKKTEPEPFSGENNFWKFENLNPEEEKQIKIQGRLLGEKNERKMIEADLKYNLRNAPAALFSAKKELEIVIKDIYLNLRMDAPQNVAEGDKGEIKIKIANNSAEKLENLLLNLFYPKDLKLYFEGEEIIGEIQVDMGNYKKYSFPVEYLEGKEEKEFHMELLLSSFNPDSDSIVNAEIGFIDGSSFIPQRIVEKRLSVLANKLSVNLFINGFSKDGYLNAGDKLEYLLSLKNEGNAVLGDIIPCVIMNDENDLIDWQTLKIEEEGKMDNKEISWNSDGYGKLSSLPPGENIDLHFSLNLKEKDFIDARNIIDNNLTSWAEIKIGMTGDLKTDKLLKSNSVALALNTLWDIKSEARYFNEDGQPIGSGPLPPRVGETTSYKIIWSLKADLNNVKEIKVKANLPKDIIWNDKTNIETGELYFNYETREIIWAVPTLPKDLKDHIKCQFEISFAPVKEDEGQIKVLLKDIFASGIDAATEAVLNKDFEPITTNLENDELGYGKGIVVE